MKTKKHVYRLTFELTIQNKNQKCTFRSHCNEENSSRSTSLPNKKARERFSFDKIKYPLRFSDLDTKKIELKLGFKKKQRR